MVQNLTDITGDNAVHNLGTAAAAASLPGSARWIQIICTGSGTCRVGGSAVSSTVGLPIAAGTGMFLPWCGEDSLYTLGQFNVYAASGATVSVAYEY